MRRRARRRLPPPPPPPRRLRSSSPGTGTARRKATSSTKTTETGRDMDTTTRARAARYELEGELGRGGMAVVYAARDTEIGRRVALKLLAAHLAGDEAFRTRFLREARIAGSLSHPNLVRVYDTAELDGSPCIVMELLEGGTLEGGRLTAEEATQVADGLAYAHSRGVVHRDLKPGNLLRTRDGVVKIADFGIARAAEE